jgi:hypothetical protein
MKIHRRRQKLSEDQMVVRRGSSPDLFSISGASDALSRSRRTVAKALRDVPADAEQSGLKLWKMSKIIAAIDANTRAPITVKPVRQGDQVLTGVAAQCAMAFQEYHDAEDAMTKLPTVDERRAFTREELWPMGMEAGHRMSPSRRTRPTSARRRMAVDASRR